MMTPEQLTELRSGIMAGQLLTVLNGDSREVLKQLPDESVQCCVTSPPYFGLRDYGVSGQIGLEPTPAEYVSAPNDQAHPTAVGGDGGTERKI